MEERRTSWAMRAIVALCLAYLLAPVVPAFPLSFSADSVMARDVEEAAASLGASGLKVFVRVTLPLMMPGIVAASALCFLVSFDEVVISLFLTGPNLPTLPVQMFHHAEDRANPLVACVAVLLIVLTLAVMIVVDR